MPFRNACKSALLTGAALLFQAACSPAAIDSSVPDSGAPPVPLCGNGSCDPDECSTCPGDCRDCAPPCGDGRCEIGESCSTCAADCGECPPECGNSDCEAGETLGNCAVDCADLQVARAASPVDLAGDHSEFGIAAPLVVPAGSADATFRLLWDDRSLYISARVSDSDLRYSGSGEDGRIWDGDSIEVLLDPQFTRLATPDATFRHVVVNVHGDRYDASGAGRYGDPALDIAALAWRATASGTLNDDAADSGYRIGIEIPWAALSLGQGRAVAIGLTLGADLALHDLDASGATMGDWAGLTDFGQSSRWKSLVLVGECLPESDPAFCARLGKNCDSLTALDNCGTQRTAACGVCSAPLTCGGGGAAGVCGQPSCTPETDAALCARLGRTCGSTDATDNCGAPRTVDCGTCPIDPTLRTVAQWESLFLQTWNVSHSRYLGFSTAGNSADYYDLAYPVDGLTAMFEASGNTQYLDRALLYVENVIADAVPSSSLADSSFRDGYLGWGAWSQYLSASDQGDEYPLYESYLWRYVGRMLRAIHDDPAVYANPVYRQKYDRLLAFTKSHIWDKWTSRSLAHVYRGNTHMASHWAYIALELWHLTGDARYRVVLDDINVAGLPAGLTGTGFSLRRQMYPHPQDASAYTWSHIWGSRTPPQDVSHGNGVVSFLVESNHLGVEWTAEDMNKFVRALTGHIWVGNVFAAAVDGSGTSRTGWYPDGFVKLGRYDAALQKRIEAGVGLSGKGVQFYGNAALNAKILNGR